MIAAVPLVHVHFPLATYVKEIRNNSSIGAWPNFLDQRPPLLKKLPFFLTCILSDFVAHESLKEFWKNNHLRFYLSWFP